MEPTAQETQTIQIASISEGELHESYFQLVWRRFRKSKPAIAGAIMIIGLIIFAIFSDFFAPYYPLELDMAASFTPPTRIRFFDANGNFHLRPFVHNLDVELDPTTFAPIWTEDQTVLYPVKFFVRSWEYKLLGLIPMDIHLFGVDEPGKIYILGTEKFGRDLWARACQAGRISLSLSLFGTFISIAVGSVLGVVSGYYAGSVDMFLQRFIEFVQSFPQLPLWMALAAIIPPTWPPLQIFVVMGFIFALLGWTGLARQVRGQVMAFRETDFILAAKEMGASDARIIFKHLYPNSLSHIIVVLTLTVPSIILAEAFLSFLGIGIQEPLVSWGTLMQDAQNLQTLGSHLWIMSPVIYIVTAVLGFNFLGDGLRDAADPYSIVR
ncbi:MAG: ABC transporter permease [Anaerolineales bacterium]|nr:ABC transporter permease [Anaerolineales bacterium]